ncbi:HAD-IIA family hydrolase [Candidatus Micrarchaeota archaeon]|nr:HAD-IIA family hydrolase [Candidatus Micrarchaeota archaeon]
MLKFKGIIFDLDGVVFRGAKAIPGAAETIQFLRGKGVKTIFLTNASMRTRAQVAEKLSKLGISAPIEQVITSSYGTGIFLREKFGAGRVFTVGENGLRDELSQAGFQVCEHENVNFVVVGLDREFTYAKLSTAFKAIRKRALFIAANSNPIHPMEDYLQPGSASMIAAISACVGKQPDYAIGKPNTFLLEIAAKQMQLQASEILVIGDIPEIDILAGNKFNAYTILVLSGVATREQAEKAPAEQKPKLVLDSIADLKKLF